MRIARVDRGQSLGWAAIVSDGAVDVTDIIGTDPDAVHRSLDRAALTKVRGVAATRPREPLDALKMAPFLPFPEKIICVGVNYRNRNEEYRDASAPPQYPSLFLRSPGSFTAHRRPLVRPHESLQLDYEGEIAIVIGAAGRRIHASRALEHIAGLTLVNEGTLRDWVRHAKFNVTQGKNFDQSGSIGPWMVTVDEFKRYDDLSLQTRVNGELRQDDTTANMIFPFEHLIEYISSFTTLQPGDIISTGTPPGAGARSDPPRFLAPGDIVEVSASGIGTLSNGVADG